MGLQVTLAMGELLVQSFDHSLLLLKLLHLLLELLSELDVTMRQDGRRRCGRDSGPHGIVVRMQGR